MKPLALILSVIGVLLLHAASPLEEIPGTNLIYTATETDAAISNYTRRALGDYVTFGDLDGALTDTKSDAIFEAGTNTVAAINAATQAVIRAIPPAPTDYIPVWEDDGWLVNEGEQISFTTLRTGDFYPDYIWIRSWSNIALQNLTTLPEYLSSGVASATNALAAGPIASVAGTVSAWETYWDGDEVRITVTNYDSAVHLPSLYIEQKLENTNAYRTVWDERTRWVSNDVQMAEMRSAIDEKADRAWGFYDSHTGNYAPDGYTWLSSPRIAIAGGLAYQRTLTTDGAVWVLVSNGMVAQTGGNAENGFFRIKDDEGNTTFEIVRGNKRTVGATASGIRVEQSGGNKVVTVPYSVVSEEHPTIYGTTDLSAGEWSQLSPQWLGQSGAWTAIVTTAANQYFIKGEYEVGGETYIKNVAPISVESGIYCTDGIHKVRPVYNNGSITWEVVQ